jgi:hypothetical protein
MQTSTSQGTVCPFCGRCPHCGQGGNTLNPFPSQIWCGTGSQILNTSGLVYTQTTGTATASADGSTIIPINKTQ